MRDDLPRLLCAAGPARTACRTPPTWRRPSTSGGPGRRRRAAAWRTGSGPARLRVSFPDRALLRAGPGRGRRCWATLRGRGERRRPVEASAVAEAAAPAIASGVDAGDRERRRLLGRRSSTARGRGCAPTSPPPSTGWRRRPPADGRDPAGQLGLSLRRRAGGALRRQPRPALGGAARAVAAPLRDRARPRARVRLRLAGRQRRRASGSSSATRGSPGTTASTAARRRARPPATVGRRRLGGAGETVRSRAAPACRASSRPASGRRCCARPRAGTSPRRCSPRS